MSKVVVVKCWSGKMTALPDRKHYRLLLDSALQTLTGVDTLQAAIQMLLPGKVIGMKANCLTRRLTNTPIPLTEALGDLLSDCGYAENNLLVWERSNRELKGAGFELNASSYGRRCFGTDTAAVGYSDEHFNFGVVNSRVSKVLTEMVDCNINLPALKDHSIAGLSGALKNLYGVIHNPNKYHANNCSPFAGQIPALEPIKRTNSLTILDATRVQYDKGPGLSPNQLAYYGGLVLSTDPVAVDTIGLEILEYYREINGQPPLAKVGREVKYLKEAANNALGSDTLSEIDLEVLVVEADGKSYPGMLL
ncbi:MAG: DUF362 domain-containing protein [bacterium]